MITIIDYGLGNLGSIYNMLKKIRVKAEITAEISDIEKAEKLILPGVGSFDTGMKNLTERNIIPVLNEKVITQKVPILGICLGMQMFTLKSQEGKLPGLGWMNAEVVKFDFSNKTENLNVPHMGWNTVDFKGDKGGWEFDENSRFYFVHSYYIKCHDQSDVFGTTTYGKKFVSSFRRDNILGVQFHPEKSHKFGMQLLKKFAEHFKC
jgi:glutamine amidotransferase